MYLAQSQIPNPPALTPKCWDYRHLDWVRQCDDFASGVTESFSENRNALTELRLYRVSQDCPPREPVGFIYTRLGVFNM